MLDLVFINYVYSHQLLLFLALLYLLEEATIRRNQLVNYLDQLRGCRPSLGGLLEARIEQPFHYLLEQFLFW